MYHEDRWHWPFFDSTIEIVSSIFFIYDAMVHDSYGSYALLNFGMFSG